MTNAHKNTAKLAQKQWSSGSSTQSSIR